MRFQSPLLSLSLLLSAATLGTATSLWGFDDATVSIHGKGAGVGGALKEKYVFDSLLLVMILMRYAGLCRVKLSQNPSR